MHNLIMREGMDMKLNYRGRGSKNVQAHPLNFLVQ